MISHLLKLLKEMLLHRCTKKETMSEVHKNCEKNIIYCLFTGERIKGHKKYDKNPSK